MPSIEHLKMAERMGLDVRVIPCEGNRQHIGALLHGEESSFLGGWSAGVVALAAIAYAAKRDFVYAESDVLSFGEWVEQLYADLGEDGAMTFGAEMSSPPHMSCSQSLILIKSEYIVDFIGRYVGHGPETLVENLPELAFSKMREDDGRIRRSFWLTDRMRPIPWDQPCISAQKWTEEELGIARKKGLL